jgi:hypothetical protein
MTERVDHIQLSREDIGILMSFATRPERFTDDVIDRLCAGVSNAELVEISAWVGLPKSTAARLAEAGKNDRTRARGQHIAMTTGYRWSIIALLGFFVVGGAVASIGSERSGLSTFYFLAAITMTAYLIYWLIVRLASAAR